MDCGGATSDPSDATALTQVNRRCDRVRPRPAGGGARCDAASVFQGAVDGEEDLSEEEKARRRAERRKAKRKVRLWPLSTNRHGRLAASKDVNVVPLSDSGGGNARSRSKRSNTRAPKG